MKIDLNLFTVFEAIYTQGSLTRAAEHLNLTQPAISHALSRLRDRLDDPLFVRHGHKMRPTPLAQNLLPEVQSALSKLRQALQQAHEFDAKSSDKVFILAMRDVVETTMLPPMIEQLKNDGPFMQLSSVSIERGDMQKKLASGELDFAVDILLPAHAHIKQKKFISDELVVLRNKSQDKKKHSLTEKMYLSAEHILVSTRASGPGLVDYSLSKLGLKRKVSLRCQHYFAACQVVNQSNLLLTMPKRYASILCAKFNDIEMLPLPIDTGNIDIYLYWHQSREHDLANIWFRNFIQELDENSSF